jgi:serine/threonine-protein kinase
VKHQQSSRPDNSIAAFVALLVAALVFVYYTSGSMPKIVASHFSSSGDATGFLPRTLYVQLTLAVVLLPPVFLVYLPRRTLRRPKARINLPNRDYWLAPERRAHTIEVLARQCTRFGEMLLVFLCYAHYLVVRANAQTPPRLATGWFLAGLVVFLGFTVLWAARLIARFRIDDQ